MAIKADISNLNDRIGDIVRHAEETVPDMLAAVGERFVDVAKSTKTYEDRTGRLTDSIGYGVFKDGTIVRHGGFGGGEGGDTGLQRCEEAGADTEGIALVVVAGMDYATYVERKGFSVLDGARMRTDDIVSEIMGRMKL